MSHSPDPWASFTDVVEKIVHPLLEDVRARIDDRTRDLTTRVGDMHAEVVDNNDRLAKATRAHAAALAGHEASSRERDSRLKQLINETSTALAGELDRAVQETASHAAGVDEAIAALANSLRRQGRVLVALSAACVALLSGLLVVLFTTR